MKQKIGMPSNHRFRYPSVLTAKGAPDKRFKCNTKVGIQRPPCLPAVPQEQDAQE